MTIGAISLSAVLLSVTAFQPGPGPCPAGLQTPAFEVTIRGFRAPSGYIRVYLYGDDPAAFLERGRWIQRIDVPVPSLSPILICLPAPRPGRYAVTVRHDVDGNRSRRDLNDGGGFSRNPRLSLVRRAPPISEVVLTIQDDVQPVDIVLLYLQGLQIRPWPPGF